MNRRAMRVVAGAVAALTVAMAVAACAADVPGRTGARSPSPGSATTNRARTEAETARLVARAQLPVARTRLRHAPASLSGPGMGTPRTSSLVDAVQLWKVAMPYPQALTWVPDHAPAGLTAQGTSGSGGGGSITAGFSYAAPAGPYWTGAELDVTIAPAGAGASDWRIDGLAQWLDPTPDLDSAAGPRLHVTPAAGCPISAHPVVGVANPGSGLDRSLLPALEPAVALVCRYRLTPGLRLSAHRKLTAAAARRLAGLARGIALSHLDDVVVNCPAGREAADLIAFGYPGGRSVDLWLGGACPSVANGVVMAGGADGGGVNGFDDAVDRLLR